MKKQLLFALAIGFLAITFTSCKKDNEVEAQIIDPVNTEAGFTFKGVKYPIIFSLMSNQGQAYVIAALSEMPSGESRKNVSFDMIFKNAPTAKIYKIAFPTGGSELALAEDEVMISAAEPADSKPYLAMSENKTVEVKVTNGKISVSIPEITLKQVTGATATGYTYGNEGKFMANFIEK